MKRPGFWDGGVLVLEEVRQQPFLQPCLFRNTPDTAVPPGFQFRLSYPASELEVDSGLVIYVLVLLLIVVRQLESCSLGATKPTQVRESHGLQHRWVSAHLLTRTYLCSSEHYCSRWVV